MYSVFVEGEEVVWKYSVSMKQTLLLPTSIIILPQYLLCVCAVGSTRRTMFLRTDGQQMDVSLGLAWVGLSNLSATIHQGRSSFPSGVWPY
jgi:hypothetical protein